MTRRLVVCWLTLFAPALLVGALAGEPRSDTSRIVTEGIVDASLDKVWHVWTTKAGLEACIVAQAEIDLRVGGAMRTHYDPKGKLGDAKSIENTILSFDPKRMLSIKIHKTPDTFPFPNAFKSTWTVLYFDRIADNQTRLRIVMQGFGDNEESQKMRQFFEKGNDFTLKKLQKHFQKKSGDG